MHISPLDAIILVILFFGLIYSSYRFGKAWLVAFLLSFYPTIALFGNIPYVNIEKGLPTVITFFVIYGVIFFFLSKSVHTRESYGGFRKVFDHFLVSITTLFVILFSLIKFVPDFATFYKFSDGIIKITTNLIPYGFYLTIPILVIFIVGKYKHD
jgi:hypothetical protein